MPFVNDPLAVRFSDLVFHEIDPSVGYSRKTINVTPPAASAPVKMGTVVFRAKSTDPFAAYAVLSAAAQLVDTNEFAVVYGDEFSFNPSFPPKAVTSTTYNAVGFIGYAGGLQLKEYYIKQIAQDPAGANLNATQFNSLKALLARQGIIVELTV